MTDDNSDSGRNSDRGSNKERNSVSDSDKTMTVTVKIEVRVTVDNSDFDGDNDSDSDRKKHNDVNVLTFTALIFKILPAAKMAKGSLPLILHLKFKITVPQQQIGSDV